MDLANSPPNINITLVYPLREELNEKQNLELDRRISEATISPEALMYFHEMLNREISDSLGLPYDPSHPEIYGQYVYYHKARIAILQELIQQFTGKVR